MTDARFCTKCGAPRIVGDAFCRQCGTRFSPQAPQAPLVAAPATPPVVSAPSSVEPAIPPPPSMPGAAPSVPPAKIDSAAAIARARSLALPLVLVAMILYIDSLTHTAPVLQIVVGSIVVVLVVFWGQLLDATGLRPQVERIPSQLRPFLLALPAVIWFAARDEGTSGSGTLVAVMSLGLTAVIGFVGPEIDRRLSGFYERRDRILPRRARVVLAAVIPLFVALAVIHGSFSALPVLFKGTTSSSASAADRTGLFVFGTLISGILAFLLLRGKES